MVQAFNTVFSMPVFPVRPEARIDIVNADWVGRAMFELHRRPGEVRLLSPLRWRGVAAELARSPRRWPRWVAARQMIDSAAAWAPRSSRSIRSPACRSATRRPTSGRCSKSSCPTSRSTPCSITHVRSKTPGFATDELPRVRRALRRVVSRAEVPLPLPAFAGATDARGRPDRSEPVSEKTPEKKQRKVRTFGDQRLHPKSLTVPKRKPPRSTPCGSRLSLDVRGLLDDLRASVEKKRQRNTFVGLFKDIGRVSASTASASTPTPTVR